MEIDECVSRITQSIDKNELVKLTFSKPSDKSSKLKNIYGRLIQLKGEDFLSFTYRYKTNDQTKNFKINEGLNLIKEWLSADFHIATMITRSSEVTFKRNKRGIHALERDVVKSVKSQNQVHDNQKSRFVESERPFLFHLGVTTKSGQIIPAKSDKYRQINKYLEIVDGLIKSQSFNDPIQIVDMGSGKGYLTFALYDYLTHSLNRKAMIFGIEIREDLVAFCNEKAELCGFDQLVFQNSTIQDFKLSSVDILIALHACDTATDDAIAFGIGSNASIIITAPCCHKQIRQQVKGKKIDNPILQHGIFKERQFEMITDTIRGLVMEKEQYNTKIFEFVSNEHTRKNIMLVGSKSDAVPDTSEINKQIEEIKKEYQIDSHYLETTLYQSQ